MGTMLPAPVEERWSRPPLTIASVLEMELGWLLDDALEALLEELTLSVGWKDGAVAVVGVGGSAGTGLILSLSHKTSKGEKQ